MCSAQSTTKSELPSYAKTNTLASPKASSVRNTEGISPIRLLPSPCEAALAVEADPGVVTDDAGAGVVVVVVDVGFATELVGLGVSVKRIVVPVPNVAV